MDRPVDGNRAFPSAIQGPSFLIEKVPSVRLDDGMREMVDFIDMDIQGAELDVVFAAIDAMDR